MVRPWLSIGASSQSCTTLGSMPIAMLASRVMGVNVVSAVVRLEPGAPAPGVAHSALPSTARSFQLAIPGWATMEPSSQDSSTSYTPNCS